VHFAFFDFDGTISTRDSFLLFLYFADKKRFLRTCLVNLPQILWYLAGHFSSHRLKEMFLDGVFRGESMGDLEKKAEQFCRQQLPAVIRKNFWTQLDFHRQHNHHVVVVTATPTFILAPWCARHEIEIIGTELALAKDGSVTGRIAGRNCKGEEKVRRIRQRYVWGDDSTIYAYGDTSGDLPMLDLAPAENRLFRPFR
jgi:phosphatidylglycerophosphatase C